MGVTFAPAQTGYPQMYQGMQQGIENQQRAYAMRNQAQAETNRNALEAARLGQQAYQFEASQQASPRDQWQHQAQMIQQRQQAETQDEMSSRALSREEQLRQSRLNNAYGQVDNLLANGDITEEQGRAMRYRVSTGVAPLNAQEERHRRSMEEEQLRAATLHNQATTVMNRQNDLIAAGTPPRMRLYHDAMMGQAMTIERANDPTASDEVLTPRAQARVAAAGGMTSMVMTQPGRFEREEYPFQVAGTGGHPGSAQGITEPGQVLPMLNPRGGTTPGNTSGLPAAGSTADNRVQQQRDAIHENLISQSGYPRLQRPGPTATAEQHAAYEQAVNERIQLVDREHALLTGRPLTSPAASPRSRSYNPLATDERGNIIQNPHLDDRQRQFENTFQAGGRDIQWLASQPGGAPLATQMHAALATMQRIFRAHSSEEAIATDPVSHRLYTEAQQVFRQGAEEIARRRGQPLPGRRQREPEPLAPGQRPRPSFLGHIGNVAAGAARAPRALGAMVANAAENVASPVERALEELRRRRIVPGVQEERGAEPEEGE